MIERAVENRAVEMVRRRDALPPLEVPVDVIVVSEQRVKDYGHLVGTILRAALREGITLHERR